MKNTLIWITSIILFIELLDTTILYSSIVPIARDFDISSSSMSLPVLSYIIGTCLFVPVVSWLSNRCNRINVIIYTLVFFSFFSLLCGIAPGLYSFSLFRFFQGIMISVCGAMAITTILSICEKDDIVSTMGIINVPALLGTAIGPFVGAVFSFYASWRMAFLVNVPICLLMSAILFMNKSGNTHYSKQEISKTPFDLAGFVLMSLFLVVISAGFEMLSHSMSRVYFILVLAGLAFGVGYVLLWTFRQTIPEPRRTISILNLRVFTNRNFSFGSIINVIARTAMCGIPVLLSIILQQAYGYSVIQAGLYLAIVALAGMIAKCLSPLLNQFGVRKSVLISAVMTSASMLLISPLDYLINNGVLWLVCALLGFSMSILYTSMNSVLYLTLDDDQMANASNIGSIIQQFSIGLGIVSAVGGFEWLVSPQGITMSAASKTDILHAYTVICELLALMMLLNLIVGLLFYLYNNTFDNSPEYHVDQNFAD
ncbi:putative transport protein HsrA [Aquicella siphonis]|uniref:Putative transport protein HsrA n=1 Tax=Aquicella siphonis TaxID=254247 RepID=A0A5E4PJ99_9COXI|nr:MFS transporter [Aquicella siphonis]VVC77149.1 putative transport protein HsrA [Aquicella siphonis]